jgi:hypothetical protein
MAIPSFPGVLFAELNRTRPVTKTNIISSGFPEAGNILSLTGQSGT